MATMQVLQSIVAQDKLLFNHFSCHNPNPSHNPSQHMSFESQSCTHLTPPFDRLKKVSSLEETEENQVTSTIVIYLIRHHEENPPLSTHLSSSILYIQVPTC